MQPMNRRAPDVLPSASGCPEFDYAPGQPNLYLMMRFKQDAVRQHGVERAFELYREKFALPPTAQLRKTRVESQRTWARRQPMFIETALAGERFLHRPPHVVGEGNHRPIAGTTRSQYVARFDDGVVRGRSAFVEVDGHLLLDVQDAEVGCLRDDIEWDPLIFHAEGLHAWGIGTGAEPPMVLDKAFTLLGAHTDFFGHWMYEYLPKYAAARLANLMPDMPVLIDAHMPPSHRQSLELLYGLGGSLIEIPAFMPVRVRQLWSAPTLSYMPLHHIYDERFSWDAIAASPHRFAPVIRELQRRLDDCLGSTDARGRVYLGRKGFRHRRLTNSEPIERAARESGFEVVYPEDLSFADQAMLARNARIIIAPEGSAIYLAFFSRPGTRLYILSHTLTEGLAEYNGLLAAHGVEVTVVSGPIAHANSRTPHDSDYSIDERVFRGVIERLA
jgi:hypothetical protein